MGLRSDKKGIIKSLLFALIVFSFLIFSVGSVDANTLVGVCTPGQNQPCGTSSCAGTQICLGSGIWGACSTSGNNCGSCMNGGCGNILNLLYGVPALSYKYYDLTSGTLTCDSQGQCGNTCNYNSGICADEVLTDQYPWASCHAGCDQNSDCPESSCVGDIYRYNRFCDSNSCQCDYSLSQNCNDLDGNYCNGNVAEKRDYSCGVNGCTPSVSGSQNCDDGNACTTDTCDSTGCHNTQILGCCLSNSDCSSLSTVCADGICNTNHECQQQFKASTTVCKASADVCDLTESCTGTSATCPKDIFQPSTTVCRASASVCDLTESCTGTSATCPIDAVQLNGFVCAKESGQCDADDICDGSTKTCNEKYALPGTSCPDSLFCNGAETCNGAGACLPATPVSCSGYDILRIKTCDNDPDNLPYTLDFRNPFTSTCDEGHDKCTTGDEKIEHTCNVDTCSAECDETHSCANKCVDDTLYNGGLCSLSSTCSCSWTKTNCNELDCSTGKQCKVDGGTMYEQGDDYSCISGTGVNCGVKGQKQCSATWTCNQQCGTQSCGGQTYTCYNNNWVSTIPAVEVCNNKVDDDCDGLIDCADSDCRDLTPPETTKTYGLPFVDNGNHYINSLTPITLESKDVAGTSELCSSGVDKIYYRTCLDAGCYGSGEILTTQSPCSCEGTQWQILTGSQFNIPEDSEHCVEFKSIDLAGNQEAVESQCVYVDNKAPNTIKVVGEVKTRWYPNAAPDDYETSYFYPEATAHCWDGTLKQIECWKVTLDTPINMTCDENSQPHPVGFEKLCFKVGWDGDDVTSSYCSQQGYSLNDNKYCCGTEDITGFKFKEESEHNLEYYCEDKLGNKQSDDEKFKVFGRMYEIDLNKKWNLISVPFDPLNKKPEAVFSEVEKNIDSVWSYDAEMKNWKVYRPNAPSLTNNLDEIKTGLGYWVMALNNDNLNIGGSLISPGNMVPPSIEIARGWNLIGHYGTESKEVYCSLLSLVDTQQGFPRWSSLWGYDNPSQAFIPLNFLQDSTHPGKGYWMEIDVDESYSPSSGCVHPAA